MSGGRGSSNSAATSSTNNYIEEEPEINGPVWYNGGIVYTGVSSEALMYKRVETSGGVVFHAVVRPPPRGRWDYYYWWGKCGTSIATAFLLLLLA